MSAKYQAYPEYKDSGVEWLGFFPTEWDAFDGKRIFKNRRELSLLEDEQLAASQKYGVIPQSLMMSLNDSKVMLALKGTSSFRHVAKNDFVISLRSFEGGIEHSYYDGCVSPAYTVLSATKKVFPCFFRYLFKSKPYIAALQSTTDSLRDGKSITFDQFGSILLVLPRLEEQQKIANFLDHETAKIDTLIEKQQQLIKLLKEKRQAVISHAVTKGLNPDAPMKDSGVEWLGDVPAHWDVISIRRVLESIQQGSSPVAANIPPNIGQTGVMKISGIKHGVFKEYEAKTLNEGDFNSKYQVSKGNLLLTRGNTPALVADVCVVNCEPKAGLMMSDLIYRLNIKSNISAHFLCYWLLSSMGRLQIQNDARGSSMTMAKVSQEHIKSWLTTLPLLAEQHLIVAYLVEVENSIMKLLSKSQFMIEMLHERRTALISAAVTGKIDVRNWQAPITTHNQNETNKEVVT